MSWLSLGLGLVVSISQFWIVYHTVARARKISWLSIWLGLAGSIFQFLDCISYSTQEGQDFVTFARVRVNIQYFQFGLKQNTVTQEGCLDSR